MKEAILEHKPTADIRKEKTPPISTTSLQNGYDTWWNGTDIFFKARTSDKSKSTGYTRVNFTMNEEHKTGANRMFELIQRFLNIRRSRGQLPQCLYMQVDNCSRENMNQFFMANILNVAQGIFSVVEIVFLPVGKTHEDIDQINWSGL